MKALLVPTSLALILTVSACDQIMPTKPATEDAAPAADAVPEVVAEPQTPDAAIVEEATSKGYTVFTAGGSNVSFPAGLQGQLSPSGTAVFSGSLAEPSPSAKTDGVSFEVPAEIETAIAGKFVKLHIVAKASAAAEFAVAYSTNEAGNTGWMVQTTSAGVQKYTFEFLCPNRIEGKLDYVGIDPKGQELEVLAIAIEEAFPEPQP
jgi:hypothetical protein